MADLYEVPAPAHDESITEDIPLEIMTAAPSSPTSTYIGTITEDSISETTIFVLEAPPPSPRLPPAVYLPGPATGTPLPLMVAAAATPQALRRRQRRERRRRRHCIIAINLLLAAFLISVFTFYAIVINRPTNASTGQG
ncbi:MAG: hypothetical protein GOMPHAMPRED_006797 [Gomphillus americanus]|uniref:Uncharacterized protein n=1 Tax=Gomphillus americanus TaxID=1940652 RepID=A0A8H3IAY1_9LECA|nr:MAG: hypothetical protein GOMPHAMPRED_006797 [Gomphillus americanus]